MFVHVWQCQNLCHTCDDEGLHGMRESSDADCRKALFLVGAREAKVHTGSRVRSVGLKLAR